MWLFQCYQSGLSRHRPTLFLLPPSLFAPLISL
nr:MAG TPA: hypothetical protein [Caudoviricetes sp.]